MRKDSFWRIIPVILIAFVINISSLSAKESVLYGGGPLYEHAAEHLEMIRSSNFTTIMLWTIHIHGDGDLVYNDIKIVDDGVYIGDEEWPDAVMAFKQGNTCVRRIEIAIGAWGSGSFNSIRDLIAAEGTGPDSRLYKNFKLLKDTIPAIDGISYDDEVTYDVDSSVKFAVMMYDLGFKVTLCPYTRSSYWRDVFSQTNDQRPGCIDRVDLQCYAGGAWNNPGTWNNYFGGLHVTPGLWCYSEGQTPIEVYNKMGEWNDNYNIAGGFMWLLDDMLKHQNTYPISDYGLAINLPLEIDYTEEPVVTLYQNCPLYDGWSAEVGEGAYTAADIVIAGGKDNDASSLSITPGYQVTLYSEDNFQGQSVVLRSDIDCLVDIGWNDILSSMVVEPIEDPVLYLKFNEGSGAVAADSTEFGFDGSITSGSWSAGKQCGGLAFDGVNDYVEIDDSNWKGFGAVSGRLDRSCCGWIKTEVPWFMICNWGQESIGGKWNVQLAPNGALGVSINGSHAIGGTDIVDGKWHHVAVVLEDDGLANGSVDEASYPDIRDISLYVDGQPEEISVIEGTAIINTVATGKINIGVDILGADYTQGAIDEFMIFSRALSADEILQIYSQYALVGDFVADGDIDLKDFSVLAYNWQAGDMCDIDLTCDCAVDNDDLMILVDEWLSGDSAAR